MSRLERSYAHCRSVARRQAKNFYYSFLLLDRERRDAMCAVYAFMRHCDDLSDEPGANRAAIAQWRAQLDAALAGDYGASEIWPALDDAVKRYAIPHAYLREMIDGVSSDLETRDIQTFDELYRYCYQVASVAGLTVIHIFGFSDARAPLLAEKCGIAFQLTNIIRDVREDRERGRNYLPREDRERFPDLTSVLRFEGERAKRYFEESKPLIELVSHETRSSLWALIEIYRRLLEKIEARGYDVMKERIRLSTFAKLRILAEALMRRRYD